MRRSVGLALVLGAIGLGVVLRGDRKFVLGADIAALDAQGAATPGYVGASRSLIVGASKAAWVPASTAVSIAIRATRVLPEPTSPWSSRSIGVSCWRSPSISATALR